MSKIENAPLMEVILEIRWGQVTENQFQFSKKEEALFPGIFASKASDAHYCIMELIEGVPPVPHQVVHRFRKKENTWPCMQRGLGIFTVNQIGKNYDWDNFRVDIYSALDIFKNANQDNIIETLNDSTLSLRYQDVFYPEEKAKISEYIKKYFYLSFELPNNFFSDENIATDIQHVNINFEIPLKNEMGVISITLVSAIINGKLGLLLDTVVQSKLKDVSSNGFNIDEIMDWANKAKVIQKHSFDAIVNEKVYSKIEMNNDAL